MRSARRGDLEWAEGNVGGSSGAVSVRGRGSHSGLMLPPWQPKAINSGGQWCVARQYILASGQDDDVVCSHADSSRVPCGGFALPLQRHMVRGEATDPVCCPSPFHRQIDPERLDCFRGRRCHEEESAGGPTKKNQGVSPKFSSLAESGVGSAPAHRTPGGPFLFRGEGHNGTLTPTPLPWLERWPSIWTETGKESQLGVLFGQTGLFGLRGGGA